MTTFIFSTTIVLLGSCSNTDDHYIPSHYSFGSFSNRQLQRSGLDVCDRRDMHLDSVLAIIFQGEFHLISDKRTDKLQLTGGIMNSPLNIPSILMRLLYATK